MTKMAVGIHVDNALPSICRFPLFEISNTRLVFTSYSRRNILTADSIDYKGYLFFYDCGAGGCTRERLLLGRSMNGQARCDKDSDRPTLREETW